MLSHMKTVPWRRWARIQGRVVALVVLEVYKALATDTVESGLVVVGGLYGLGVVHVRTRVATT